ncbi:Rho guanine nucleotide exchange factor 17 [Operophtera brumata]|uniref:Rho guanine nucleotide exchange factor 17 n=1 Tax=Operophtera brumata TaxID=104452 RepID=A0A0L7L771_OPEBR|nr:Rho guanine nucleotide exchange factor 17 [Operophtera brumata]
MAVAGGAIWLSLHNAAQLRCYHATTREQLAEINITAQVTKMLHGITYGHTGHVRFLTIVENPAAPRPPTKTTQTSLKTKALSRRSANADKLQKQADTTQSNKETLIISGGDGYEDFRSSSTTEDAGREDSTNHLLLWRV